MKKKVTIQDIADALGISRNTVSKAINNSDGLADSTREKILQKAIEMGYKQFSYVQSLYRAAGEQLPRESAQLQEVALLTGLHLTGSHFASTMLDRLQQELSRLGYRLNSYYVRPEDIADGTLPVAFAPDKVSAIVCIEMFDWDYDVMLCELGLPILFIDGPVRHDGRTLPADQLSMDSFFEVQRLVSGMLAKGVRRIGFIGDPDHCSSFHERYCAVWYTMGGAGVRLEKKFILRELDEPGIYRALKKLKELPELFVCANDFVAYEALQALHRLGKDVPGDVMLAGFDDTPESRTVVPPLTTVHIHTQIIAYSAAQLLTSRIESPSLDLRRVYTETELICRESTKFLPNGETTA